MQTRSETFVRSLVPVFALALTAAACGDDGDPNAADESSSTGSADASSDTTAPGSDSDSASTSTTGADGSSSDGSSGTTGDEASLLDRVVAALGGADALSSLSTIALQAQGSRWSIDEGDTPRQTTVPASDYDIALTWDLQAQGLRLDVARTLTLFDLGLPLSYSEIVAGPAGYIDGVDNLFQAPSAPMLPDRVAATVRQQQLLHPQVLLRAVLADPSGVRELGAIDLDGRPHERLQLPGSVRPIVLWIDSETDQISRLTTIENDPLRRDVEVAVDFVDWQASDGGVAFAGEASITVDGIVIASETRSGVSTTTAPPPDAFTLPASAPEDPDEAARGERNSMWSQSFVGAGIPLAGLQTQVVATEIAPGVHHLWGGTHHSLVVEQSGGVVLFETPLYEARCVAVLDWIDANLDGAAVTHAVVSHHHVDHAACARTLVARGATLVVGTGAESVWDEVLAAPSTVEPDELAANPVDDPAIEIVPDGGEFTLDDATNPVTVYDLENPHAADLVLPVVEGAGVAFVVDLYNPGFPFQVFGPVGAQAVLASLELHGALDAVSLIAGGHGFGTATLAELQAAAGG
ncbi:MAG: MBL fold metallo-hydrolase [Nannocystaceae bacterium]|nr:MBL fold metallo-hydrolase [Nannocystaceae bacterium]